MILKYFGKDISIDNLKKEIKIDKEGTTAYEIIKISKKHGINATGYKNFDIKTSHTFPIIAHTINNKLQHFVVVLKTSKDMVLVADPAKGIVNISIKEFENIYTGVAITFENMNISIKSMFKSKRTLALIIFIILFLSLINILYSYMLSYVIENFSNNTVNLVIILLFIIGVFKEVFSLIKERLLLKYQLSIDRAITIPTLKKIITLPHSFYQRMGSGELISKVNDLSHVKDMIFAVSQVLFVNVIVIFISLIFVSIINCYLLIINFIVFLFIYFVNKRFYKKHLYETYDLQIKNEVLGSKISDTLIGIISIKNLSKEKYFGNKICVLYDGVIDRYKNLNISYQKRMFISKLVSLFVIILMIILLMNMNITTNVLFALYTEIIILDSINSLCDLEPIYTNFKSAYARIKEVWEQKGINDEESLINIENIKFKNLNYNYEDNVILNNFNLVINKNDFVMINGSTGSGKTTLFKILTKQLKICDNKVFINNQDVNSFSEKTIRRSITYVDQKTKLFNETLIENINLGSENKLKPRLKRIISNELNKNNIDYNYLVDNTNSNLSGGQVQLIIIAQTIVNGGDLIIFDETTSQLDEKTERNVLRAIKEDYPEKTIILISHRKSNMDLFTKIINFDADKIKKRRINEEVKKRRIKKNKSRSIKRLGYCRNNCRNNIRGRDI